VAVRSEFLCSRRNAGDPDEYRIAHEQAYDDIVDNHLQASTSEGQERQAMTKWSAVGRALIRDASR
jgi:hypothetical protein